MFTSTHKGANKAQSLTSLKRVLIRKGFDINAVCLDAVKYAYTPYGLTALIEL